MPRLSSWCAPQRGRKEGIEAGNWQVGVEVIWTFELKKIEARTTRVVAYRQYFENCNGWTHTSPTSYTAFFTEATTFWVWAGFLESQHKRVFSPCDPSFSNAMNSCQSRYQNSLTWDDLRRIQPLNLWHMSAEQATIYRNLYNFFPSYQFIKKKMCHQCFVIKGTRHVTSRSLCLFFFFFWISGLACNK